MSRNNSVMPPRCVKCNQPAALPIRPRALYWHSRWFYILIPFGLVTYFIVGLIVRKKATVGPGLCAVHRQNRTRLILFSWLSLLASVWIVAHGFSSVSGGVVFLGFQLMVTAMVALLIVTRFVYPTMIDEHFVWIRGCGEAFLAGFPQLPPHYIPR